MLEERTAYRTCPLCEATCGLEITVGDGEVLGIRGDDDDVFSHGFICPKGFSLKALHEDPDRLRTPMRRTPSGDFEPISWDEAFAEIDRGLSPILADGDRNAVAAYLGNPSAHHLAPVVYGRVFLRALGSRSVYTASTVDQMPKQVAVALMFGAGLSVPVPDVDRTDFLLVLGANPLVSNGSLMTAPDMRGRIRAIRARGGRVVVVDPRRTRTAEEAGEHLFIRPGADALLLFAIVNVLAEEGLVSLGRLAGHTDGVEAVLAAAEPFTPEAVAGPCGIAADTIRSLARDLAAAERAAVYGRIGTCTQRFGTLASWLVDVVNVLTGNLDREGGAMFPQAAAGQTNSSGAPGRGRGARFGRWSSRVRGAPELFGELPVACLAEEIETPGDGRLRALVTIAGNPVLSTPNSERLARALDSLEFMVSLDIYVNETTRHANVILPAPSPLEIGHYDLAFTQLAVRNFAHWSAPVLEPADGALDEWESLLRLTGIVTGQGPDADVEAIDAFVIGEAVKREVATAGSRLEGREVGEILEALGSRRGPERMLDLMLRAGPYGDAFGANPDGLTLEALEAAPHGIDLGPLKPRIPEMLRTASGRVELAPEAILADVPRLEGALKETVNGGMVLVGRRQLRSNNSWMRNLPVLAKGRNACTVHVHPDDAARLGLADGELAEVSSRTGSIEVEVEVTDGVMPGVVSIPHGWGHDLPGVQLRVAREHAGANSNVLADERETDPLSGNAVLNGIPVELVPVPAGREAVPA